ncbi:hypothetical protein CCZ01_07710 [Helicobacter monodelphidis]|uniref:F0F1 ATP synthase subunit delta n=1 Tax=Helicobacter sp. 15-1451 TaxID=2004995 RepID=UPI000DCC7B05|nr:F0F1 ATP synthase subunit delta [Helicobacter sp. 15-1451]RAX56931.1 hypothetical protein CCZ01_07710 [Helicobacter sp. 15-1451]
MKELIAKKYTKALTESFKAEEIVSILESLRKVESAFEDSLFCDIIATPSIQEAKKTEVILDITGRNNSKLINFVKLLGEKNRFEIIPDLCRELERRLATMRSEYTALLYTQEAFSDDVLKNIEVAFAKRLNVRLALVQKISNDGGVRLVVEDLGVEVAFSKEKFVNDLRDHILKAF